MHQPTAGGVCIPGGTLPTAGADQPNVVAGGPTPVVGASAAQEQGMHQPAAGGVCAPGGTLPIAGADQPNALASFVAMEPSAGRIKLSSVLDQGDDTEIKPLTVPELRVLLETWKAHCNDGEDPQEAEETTGDQLSALAYRIRSGATPYADFGIWRPCGADLGRALKFVAWFLSPGGEYTKRELSGPASFAEWKRAWRVYSFAMEVLQAASRTRLKRYMDTISDFNDDYPDLWWLIACADHKMRKMQFERIRRRLAKEHAEVTKVGLAHDFDPKRPWDLVIKEAAVDRDFWHKEIDRKVLQYTTAQRNKEGLTDPGFGELRFEPGFSARSGGSGADERPAPKRQMQRQQQQAPNRPSAAQRRKLRQQQGQGGGSQPPSGGGGAVLDFNRRDAQGRFLLDGDGTELCWEWNRSHNGCSAVCPRERVHKCEYCRRDNHRSCEHVKGGKKAGSGGGKRL